MKILLSADSADGSSNPSQLPANGTAPAAAETVANGKSEREALLERENAKLREGIKKTAELKRKVEIEHAHLADENHRLKQVPSPAVTPAKEKFSFMGFTQK